MAFSVTAAGINVTNPGTYELHDEGFTFNGVTFIQRLVESSFMDGAIEVNRTKAMTPCGMVIDVKGSTGTEVQTRLDTLIAALAENGDWTLTAVVNGATYSWRCMPVNNYRISTFDRFFENNEIKSEFSFLRYPIPLAGGIG